MDPMNDPDLLASIFVALLITLRLGMRETLDVAAAPVARLRGTLRQRVSVTLRPFGWEITTYCARCGEVRHEAGSSDPIPPGTNTICSGIVDFSRDDAPRPMCITLGVRYG